MTTGTALAESFEVAHVLFMDIVGYSKLPMDEEMRVLRDLQTIVQGTADFSRANSSGNLISLPTGDGMALAFFNAPEAPLRCALEIAEELKSHPDIKLRMGIHTGPVYRLRDIKDSLNIAGGGINMAQRVMDCGDAGHILVSRATAEILKQHSGWAKYIRPLGIAQVKHGVKIEICNICTETAGNTARPNKLRSSLSKQTEQTLSMGRRRPLLTVGLLVGVLAICAAAGIWLKHLQSEAARAAAHKRPAGSAISVLISDFENATGEPVFDSTLESAFGVALEGASFVTDFDRAQAHKIAAQLRPGATQLDESLARLVATREGVSVVATGSIRRQGDDYLLSVQALDSVTGKTLANDSTQAGKDEVLPAVSKLAQSVLRALGDTSIDSEKLAAAETFTCSSLEAAHEYAVGQDLHLSGKWTESIEHFRKAIDLDPTLGRAYSGLAAVYYNTGQVQEAIKYYKLALSNIDLMSEREKLRTQGAYYAIIRDPDKTIEVETELLKRYPSDNAGHANLALAYFFRREMPRALEEGQQAVEIYPKNVAQRNNVGLYAMYAGDFERAIQEQKAVLQLNPSFTLAYMGMGLAQLGLGKNSEARDTYSRLGTLGADAASAAAVGSADLAMYEGRPGDAIKILTQAIPADVEKKQIDAAARKWALLAQAQFATGDVSAAVRSAQQAASMSSDTGVLFWSARAYIGAGDDRKAMAIANQLSSQIQSDPQAYGKIIEGEIALRHGGSQQAMKLFAQARAIADTWLGRFDAARAYLEAGAYSEAYSELEVCQRRRGEATALFLDESPTYSVFPEVYYYLGRAQEGLHSPAARESFTKFLATKTNKLTQDELVTDAQARLEGRPATKEAQSFSFLRSLREHAPKSRLSGRKKKTA